MVDYERFQELFAPIGRLSLLFLRSFILITADKFSSMNWQEAFGWKTNKSSFSSFFVHRRRSKQAASFSLNWFSLREDAQTREIKTFTRKTFPFVNFSIIIHSEGKHKQFCFRAGSANESDCVQPNASKRLNFPNFLKKEVPFGKSIAIL